MRSTARPDSRSNEVLAHLVVRWGASVIHTCEVRLGTRTELLDGRVRIEPDIGGATLFVDDQMARARLDGRVRLSSRGLEADLDATAIPPLPVEAISLEPVRAASSAFSWVLHGGLLLAAFVWAPLAREPEMTPDFDAMRSYLSRAGGSISSADPGDHAEQTASSASTPDRGDAPKTNAKAPRGASGSPRSQHSVATIDPETNDGRSALESEIASTGMIGLLSASNVGAGRFEDPWANQGQLPGAWNDEIGDGFGVGGIGLSGIGEGGGHGGLGQGLAGAGRGFCADGDCGLMGMDASGKGRSFGLTKGRGHRSSVRMGPTLVCGTPIGEPSQCNSMVSGRLPPEVVQRVIRQNFGRYRLCFEQHLRTQPSVDTRVSVSFVIGRDGSVSNAKGSGDQADLASCVAGQFRALSFPQPEGGVVRVTYPILFQAGE